MEATPRIRQILTIMLKEQQTMSVQSLAEKMGVSKRTVQRELESVNSSLKGYEIRFMSKTGAGVWLEGSQEEKSRLREDLDSGDSYDAANREERRKRLILEILKDKGLKKLFYYSSKFKVSEATVSADLEAVEEWLNRYGLKIVRKPGSGVVIEGSERSYRKAIRTFINENIDTRLLQEAYETDDSFTGARDGLQQSSIGQILNDDILKRVIQCIMGMADERVMDLTENAYMGLVIHITIAINRMLKNEVLEADEDLPENMEPDEDYALAERMVRELEEEFEIRIPPVEISYICLHIKGAKHERIQWNGEKTVEMENRQLQQMVNEMIDVFDRQNAFLLKQDEEFIQGLLAHLQPTFIRILYDMQISNPMLDSIKKDYPEIFRQCTKVAKVMEKRLGKPVPETETGFLAVHFGAAMVRLEGRNEQIRQVRIGVVCSSGIGISRLMMTKLEKAFRGRTVITPYGKKDITPYIAGKTDFFVSSIPLELSDAPVIFVNPLLSEQDMEQVRRMVYQYERTPDREKEETEFSRELEEINLMAAQINAVLKYADVWRVRADISFGELLETIGEFVSPYRDQEEMIREDLMKREKMASQVFAEFGFALLHTRTEGVIRPCFHVCLTDTGQPFEDGYFKGIQAVFVMLLPRDENIRINSDILGYISTVLIEDYSFMETALTGDREAIRKALSVHLKKFFNKYLSQVS